MDLYNLHLDPQSLFYYREVDTTLPKIFWGRYKNNPEELKKREKAIAKSIKYSYYYARDVLKGPFPLGEDTISKSVKLFMVLLG